MKALTRSCPNCRSKYLNISQLSTAWKSFEFDECGHLIELGHANDDGDPLSLHGTCHHCGHEWTLKGVKVLDDIIVDILPERNVS